MRSSQTFQAIVRRELSRNKDLYAPLRVSFRDPLPKSWAPVVQLSWNNRKQTFVAKFGARSAPKLVQEGVRVLKGVSAKGRNRLLILPYLSSAVVDLIESEDLSALDLNGNYFIRTPELLAIRLDRPNRFKESQPIKKIYSGNSSIVGRYLLIEKKTYESVNSIFRGIRALGVVGGDDPLSLPTVSKVLKGLEEDLLIEKKRDAIRVLQPEMLLDRLRDNYRPPRVNDQLGLKIPERTLPLGWRGAGGISILTGESSAQEYVTTTPPQIYSMYVADISEILKRSKAEKYVEDRFPNVVLRETREAFVYVNDNRAPVGWASPLQTYLELSRLDKREKELAEDVRKVILRPFQ